MQYIPILYTIEQNIYKLPWNSHTAIGLTDIIPGLWLLLMLC